MAYGPREYTTSKNSIYLQYVIVIYKLFLTFHVFSQVKQGADDNVFRPAMDIVDDIMLEEVRPNDVVLPKKPLLKRVANRFRAKRRPQEPRDLEFEVTMYSQMISRINAYMYILLHSY